MNKQGGCMMKRSTWSSMFLAVVIIMAILLPITAGIFFVQAYLSTGVVRYFIFATGLVYLGAFFFWVNVMYGWKNLFRKLKNKQVLGAYFAIMFLVCWLLYLIYNSENWLSILVPIILLSPFVAYLLRLYFEQKSKDALVKLEEAANEVQARVLEVARKDALKNPKE